MSKSPRNHVLLAHPGTQYSFRLAEELCHQQCLDRFCTGVAWPGGGAIDRLVSLLPYGLQRKLSNRRVADVPFSKLRLFPIPELRATWRLRHGHDDQAVLFERNQRFQELISDRDILDSDVVVGFDTSSWILAARARDLQRPFVLDQSIAHPLHKEQVALRIRRDFPEWSEDLPMRNARVLETERIEHQLAPRIAVASTFTHRSLVANGVDERKIETIPYGVNLDAFSVARPPSPQRPLRFLFLGTVNARKGVPLLCQAWERLAPKEAELWLAGPVSGRNRSLIPPHKGLKVLGKLPHSDLPGLMNDCDVLVFPSYFEGFGLVLLEAMAAGMPVITTDATAGPDLMVDDEEGFVLPAGDLDRLVQAMRLFVDETIDLPKMSRAARRRAEQYSWSAYGERWSTFLAKPLRC